MTTAGIIFLIVLAIIFCIFLIISINEGCLPIFFIGFLIVFFIYMAGFVLNEAYHHSDNPTRYEIIPPERYIRDDQQYKCVIHIRDSSGGIGTSLTASTKQEFNLFHADNVLIKKGYTTNMFGWDVTLGYFWFPKDAEETANLNRK